MNQKECGRKQSWFNLRYYLGICQENHKHFGQPSGCTSWGLNLACRIYVKCAATSTKYTVCIHYIFILPVNFHTQGLAQVLYNSFMFDFYHTFQFYITVLCFSFVSSFQLLKIILFITEAGKSFLWNVITHLPHCTVSHLRTSISSYYDRAMKATWVAHVGGNPITELQLGHEMKAQLGISTNLLTICK